jgi:hypothetical protein
MMLSYRATREVHFFRIPADKSQGKETQEMREKANNRAILLIAESFHGFGPFGILVFHGIYRIESLWQKKSAGDAPTPHFHAYTTFE